RAGSVPERLEHVAGRDQVVVGDPRTGDVAAEQHRCGGADRGLQVADVAGRGEVLVLVGDPHVLDPVTGRQPGEHGVDELLRGGGPGGDPDGAGQVVGQLAGVV